jgi:PD-(D/E)XK nuclease superfamily
MSSATITEHARAGAVGSSAVLRAEVSALELARRIPIPPQLPVTYKGEPLRCLSATSIEDWLTCRDSWRRRYILGLKSGPSGAMFLGSRLDEVETAYFRSLLDGGGPLSAGQLRECLEDRWREALAEETDRYGGVRWEEGSDERSTHEIAVSAIDVFLEHIAPVAGTPLGLQRHFDFVLAEGVKWTVTGEVDLDTVRPVREFVAADGQVIAVQELLDPRPTVDVVWSYVPEDLRPALQKRDPSHSDAQAAAYQDPVEIPVDRVPADPVDREAISVDDYKAKKSAIYKGGDRGADHKVQPSIYCLERWLRGVDLYGFRYLQLLAPAKGVRKNISHKITPTKRTPDQLESFLVLIAEVASAIVEAYETRGPDRPWGFAPPGHWKCRPNSTGTDGRYCPHWRTCPRGIGIGSAR